VAEIKRQKNKRTFQLTSNLSKAYVTQDSIDPAT